MISSYTGSGYLGSGIRRSNSRYRPSASGNLTNSSTPISTISTNSSTSSNYYTPQVRRKYGSFEPEHTKSISRYVPKHATNKPSHSPSSSGSPSANASSTRYHSKWSPNKSPVTPGYGTSHIGNSSSWNSDLKSVVDNTVDYKRLYEAEKLATDELRKEVDNAQKEMEELTAKIDAALEARRINGAEKRKMQRRISECEEELKLLDKYRAESEKLQAEHRALVRVVSRLNREQ